SPDTPEHNDSRPSGATKAFTPSAGRNTEPSLSCRTARSRAANPQATGPLRPDDGDAASTLRIHTIDLYKRILAAGSAARQSPRATSRCHGGNPPRPQGGRSGKSRDGRGF